VYDKVISYLLQFKEVHIVTGNHDRSDQIGNSLLPLKHFRTIYVYEDVVEVYIEGILFLMLPFQGLDKMKEYPSIKKEYDYVVTHIAPPGTSWGIGEIDLNLTVKKAIINGHIHNYKTWKDKLGNTQYLIGTPQCTRNLEQKDERKGIEINCKTKDYTLIDLPVFYTIEDIEYGNEPTSKNNLLNIKNAPSVVAVYEKYKGYNIRHEGIQILRTASTLSSLDELKETTKSQLVQKVNKFYAEKKPPLEIQECINKYLSLKI
jgi:hypothetical protein